MVHSVTDVEPIEDPEISVIIPVHNAGPFLALQLESLAQQDWDGSWEVILVDNHSTDDGIDRARAAGENLPSLRILDAPENLGTAGYPRNIGAAATNARSLLFLDQDDEVAPGYLAAMASALRSHRLVCARLDCDTLNPEWQRETRGRMQQDGPEVWVNNVTFLPFCIGCSMGIRRSLFEEIGGYDPALKTTEDNDICWRAQFAGATLQFVPDAVVRYRYRSTLRENFRQAVWYSQNDVYLYKRYLPFGMHRLTVRENLYQWKALLKESVHIGSREGRARFVVNSGYRLGRLRGSIRERKLML